MLISLALGLTGCAEMKKIVTVLFHKNTSINTRGFEFIDMASGNGLTCSLMADKSLRCLGSGVEGNLGRYFGIQNNVIENIKQVATGNGFTCLIIGDAGELKCFGHNDHGQLGNNTNINSTDPVPVLDAETNNNPIVGAKQITAGEQHACALLKNGRAICWGDNSYGQAGNSYSKDAGVKTVLENDKTKRPFSDIKQIAAGGNSTCIIAGQDESLYCFGERYGSKTKFNFVPEKLDIVGMIQTLSEVKQVSLGNGFGCALSRTKVYCWGKNDHKQLGSTINASGSEKAVVVEVHFPIMGALSKIEMIATGENHACGIHRDEGTVFCWGENEYGQLGTTSRHGQPERVAVGANNLSLKNVKYLAAGKDRTCTITKSDELYCFGNGIHGLLGNEKQLSTFPVHVLDPNLDPITSSSSIAIGTDHACVIGNNSKLYCFGLNQYGQLGSRMIANTAISDVSSFDTQGDKTCAIYSAEKKIACFGDKTNSFTQIDLKVQGNTVQGASGVSIGKNLICFINKDTKIECIDYDTTPSNHYTVMKSNDTPLTDIWLIRSRNKLTCGLTREKGELWCWGSWKNNNWRTAKRILASGKETQDFLQFSLSDQQICAVYGTKGDIYCTGDNEKSRDDTISPLLDAKGKPFTGAYNVVSGRNHSCTLDFQNRIFCWGSNQFSQIGSKTESKSNYPIRVPIKDEAIRGISHVTAGDDHTCYTTLTDTSLYCFGASITGEPHSTDHIEFGQ
jgi:alpha-tubulin suppressor-like RCC1 family protein